jgi:hypothetical protein
MLYITLPKALYPELKELSLRIAADLVLLDTLTEELPRLTAGTNAAYSGELAHGHLRAYSNIPYLLEQGARLDDLFQGADARGANGDGHYTFEAGEFTPTNWVGHVAINLKYSTDPRIMRGRGRSNISKIIAGDWDARLKKLQLTAEERERFDIWRTKFITVLSEIHELTHELYADEATQILWQPIRAHHGHPTENPQSVAV